MFILTKSTLHSTATVCLSKSPTLLRRLGTHAQASRKEGDISSVFVSLSGVSPEPLPQRFADIKRQLIQGNEAKITSSWKRLLEQLAVENETVTQKGPEIIPQIQFKDLQSPPEDFIRAIKKRGVAVVRGVIPEDEARGYKTEVEEYVKLNPWTKGMFLSSPQLSSDTNHDISIPQPRSPSFRALLVPTPSPRPSSPKHDLGTKLTDEPLALGHRKRPDLHVPTPRLRRPDPHPETRRQPICTRTARRRRERRAVGAKWLWARRRV